MILSVLVYCCYSVHGADARQHALANLQRSGCAPLRRRSLAEAYLRVMPLSLSCQPHVMPVAAAFMHMKGQFAESLTQLA